ncbi:hypothetical protein GN244_ATG12062 [Phytophthora infestans]|uniref:Uncharacterized protein n=1 Tax=Phytophthora infestans TaxID=4787 RepID=A0A833SNP2_PHYIN|nr:hypothetical protein GN244_ATG12062 [Phytophthora infestans]KAF4133102.1 hypothetical protein GN958_ATG17713 [Phytophthora infestans]
MRCRLHNTACSHEVRQSSIPTESTSTGLHSAAVSTRLQRITQSQEEQQTTWSIDDNQAPVAVNLQDSR